MRLKPNRRLDGFDVAWAAVSFLGVFLTTVVVVLGIDAIITAFGNPDAGSQVLSAFVQENGQTVMVACIGAIATVAGGALGYQVGLGQDTQDEEQTTQ